MNKEFFRMQQLAGIIKEGMFVNRHGELQNLKIPQGWEEFTPDTDQDPEEDIEIKSYGAPMEGWDKDHYDFVNIMKTPEIDPITEKPLQSKYYVQTYISFGDVYKSEMFDSFKQAEMEAISEMNEIKSDWGKQ
jgi:hypothetical protein